MTVLMPSLDCSFNVPVCTNFAKLVNRQAFNLLTNLRNLLTNFGLLVNRQALG